MAHRPLTSLAALACAAVLAACSNGGPVDDPTPVETQTTVASTPADAEPTEVDSTTPSPEPTAQEAEPEPALGELLQATYDAIVASQPEHPLLRNAMVTAGGIQATLAAHPATEGMVVVDGIPGQEPMENTYGDVDSLPAAPTVPAAGVEIGKHWEAAVALRPDCTEFMAEFSALHTGVPAARFTCGLEEKSAYVMIGDEGFSVLDDYFGDDGVAQVMDMAAAAGVADVNALLWDQALGPQLTVPGPSVPLTDGQTCTWTFVPTSGGSLCFEAPVTYSFPLTDWAESLPMVLDAALPLVAADGGFFVDPAFGIEIDEVTGEPVATFVSADQQFYEFGADGTQLS